MLIIGRWLSIWAFGFILFYIEQSEAEHWPTKASAAMPTPEPGESSDPDSTPQSLNSQQDIDTVNPRIRKLRSSPPPSDHQIFDKYTGFSGLLSARRKRMTTSEPLEDFLQKGSQEEEVVMEEEEESLDRPKTAEATVGSERNWNAAVAEDPLNVWDDTLEAPLAIEKKGKPATGFFGMRGKKEDSGEGAGQKRASPSSVFYGMRGKKQVDVAAVVKRAQPSPFYGMRGKKLQQLREDNVVVARGHDKRKSSAAAFYGMRGKKAEGGDDWRRQMLAGGHLEVDKRSSSFVNGFLGMRGKKWAGPIFPTGSLTAGSHVSQIREANGLPQDRDFFSDFWMQQQQQPKQGYTDRKRQFGRIFIGMRG